jgi:hypothetical protein
MRLLVLSSCSEANVDWCEYAVVHIGPSDRLSLLRRRELYQKAKAEDSALRSLDFWAALGVTFYDGASDVPKLLGRRRMTELAKTGYVVVPDDFASKVLGTRTDCECLCVNEQVFWWQADVKHTDATAATRQLPYSLLDQRAAATTRPKRSKARKGAA